MADEAYAGQAQACLIRVSELDDTGAPEGDAWVSDGLIQLDWSPNVDSGDELEQVNGCGVQCLFFKAPDRINYLDLSLQMCAPEPDLMQMLAGGTVHTLAGSTVGHGLAGTGTIGEGVNDVSIELWERIIVDGSIVGHARYVFPRTRDWHRTGSTHQNDILNVELEGIAVDAGAWGDGPGDDWNLLSAEPVTLYDWAIETQDLPAPTAGAGATT